MLADKPMPDIPDEVIESLARCILPSIRAYFDSEEGQRVRRMEGKEAEGIDCGRVTQVS